jgi:hypothetical protein
MILAACAPHDPTPDPTDEGMVRRMWVEWESILLLSEENRFTTPEIRAAVRERQRREGLRVCEEGEHGTTWTEDCKICTCVHGRRSCPPVVCTHNSKVRETGIPTIKRGDRGAETSARSPSTETAPR